MLPPNKDDNRKAFSQSVIPVRIGQPYNLLSKLGTLWGMKVDTLRYYGRTVGVDRTDHPR